MKRTIEGIAIEYRDEGEGRPIVWIHGYPLASAIFEAQFAIRGVRHLAPDLPGFGGSESRPALTIDDYALLVLRLLDELGIERAVFGGVSMGGYVAMAIARRAKHRLAGLILIDTRETPDTAEAREGRYTAIETVRKEGTRPVIESMLPKMLTTKTIENDTPAASTARSVMQAASPEGVISALAAMAERPDASDVISTIDAPLLIVVGEHDSLTPRSDAERMHAAAAESTLVVLPGAAHLSNLEQPGPFNDAVQLFLSKHALNVAETEVQ
jgi:3-oxoadipate enol-lactonase